MIDNVLFAVTLAATLGCGLIAGVFFAFSTFVVKALARLPASEGIAAMQSINVVVVNPVFLAVFLGTVVACIVVVIAALLRWHAPGAAFLLLGGALYVIGSFLVTALCNIPLNDALASVVPTAPESAGQWANYVANWMIWNHVRGIASLAATAALIIAMVRNARLAN